MYKELFTLMYLPSINEVMLNELFLVLRLEFKKINILKFDEA